MRVNGKMINLMEKEFKTIQMEDYMKENFCKEKKMIKMVLINGQMVKFIQDNSEMDLWKGTGKFICQMDRVNMQDSFQKI